MKILVIEDNKVHIDAATKQLTGHEITVVKSWKDMLGLSDFILSREEHIKFFKGHDMVFTDINISGISDYNGETLNRDLKAYPPMGLWVILRAIEFEIKYIASLTDSNHHTDALTKSLNNFGANQPFYIGKSKVILSAVYPKDWKKMFDYMMI